MPGSYFKVWSLPSYPCLRFYHTNHACLPFQSHTTTVSLSSEKQVWESLSIQSLFSVHVLAHTNQLWIRQPIKDKVDAWIGYTFEMWKLKINQDNAKIMEVQTEQDKDQARLSDSLNQTLIDERLDMAIDSSISQRPCVTLLNIDVCNTCTRKCTLHRTYLCSILSL